MAYEQCDTPAEWIPFMSSSEEFVAARFEDMRDGVVTSTHIDGQIVTVVRSTGTKVRFGVLSKTSAEEHDVANVLDQQVDFVLNLPAGATFQGEAIRRCEEYGVAWGGLADGMRAVLTSTPRSYVAPELRFVLGGLKAHSHVTKVTFVDSRRLKVTRKNGLPALILYIESKYQAEVDSARSALQNFTPFDIFVATNPNAGPTKQASAVVREAGLEILRWGDTLRRLRE